MQQIMANVLTKVNPITLMQGTVDWKYARRFSFTSASSYDVIHLCTTKLWHLFESKPHWQALKAYLDGASLLLVKKMLSMQKKFKKYHVSKIQATKMAWITT